MAVEPVRDETPEEQHGAAQPDARAPLELVLERLAGLEVTVAEFQRRSEHREGVIDRLYEENQRLRAGVWRALLEPVLVDLVRMHDALTREARARASGPSAGGMAELLGSFADDVEQTLERCGVEAFSSRPGDPHRPREHQPVGTVVTEDYERHNTVAEVVALGFRDRETGRIYRPLRARFHQYRPSDESK